MEEEEENVNEVISEVRNPSDKDIDSEEDDFWMPPLGERWDIDDGGDRWGSGSESGPKTDYASEPGTMDDFVYQWPYTNMTQLRKTGIDGLNTFSVELVQIEANSKTLEVMAAQQSRRMANMTQPRETGIDGVNAFSTISTQIEELSRTLDVIVAQRSRRMVVTCDYCAENHQSHQCTVSSELVQYSGDYLNNYVDPNYHQDWGYHSNSLGSYIYDDQYYAPNPSYTPKISCPPPLPQEEKPNLRDIILKGIANLEEMRISQELSTQNFNNRIEQFVTTSTNGPQYMASKTETDNSRSEELLSKFIASNEERIINQEKLIQNLQNKIDQMTKAVSNLPLNTWLYDMDDEIDGEPDPNLRLDEPQDIENVETIGDNEIEVNEDLNGSPPKIKEVVKFVKSFPLGSHVVDKALYHMRASTNVKPWWDEEEKIEEEPVVLDKPQSPNLIIDSTDDKAPSYLTFSIGHLFKQSMLGDFKSIAITKGNLPKVTLFSMDGGFLNYRRGIG